MVRDMRPAHLFRRAFGLFFGHRFSEEAYP
jgi:hypothetical protein